MLCCSVDRLRVAITSQALQLRTAGVCACADVGITLPVRLEVLQLNEAGRSRLLLLRSTLKHAPERGGSLGKEALLLCWWCCVHAGRPLVDAGGSFPEVAQICDAG